MASETSKNIHELESQLLQLEPHTRATLAKTLLASLDDLSDQEYEQLWAEEAEARYADFLAGRTSAVDGDEVFARARARLR
jgi:putative addiction module component (TIGR02574 family)